ncbi:alpha-hydroxy acid oxidase [Caballeronia sp. INDeC2]|uniref:alpha-hydroxy acid oxidase n=1 Tax=Caballeronia sp. INDeC2 TaxID=2921747 RepID=UPI0020297643
MKHQEWFRHSADTFDRRRVGRDFTSGVAVLRALALSCDQRPADLWHYPAEFRTGIGRVAVAENVKLAASLTWKDVEEIRRFWKGNLIVKGVLDLEDARLAVAHGRDGIVISSHGGRNFDSGSTVVDRLPEIAEALGNKTAILADSGVRRGSDVVKYLSLSAEAVLCGRAPLYGVGGGRSTGRIGGAETAGRGDRSLPRVLRNRRCSISELVGKAGAVQPEADLNVSMDG